MSNWRVLYVKQSLTKNVSVGMWKEQSRVFFTIEGLKPEDVINQDIEFNFSIKELESILTQARAYEKEIADD